MKKKQLAPTLIKQLQKASLKAADEAGEILKKYFRKKILIKEKDSLGWVTEVDLKAEARIIKILKKWGPQDFSFLAEESGTSASAQPKSAQSGRWIIDPLDGTNNYAKGFPFFCVSIAAEFEGVLCQGIVYQPILKELFKASLHQGAFLNQKKISVSKTKKLEKAFLTTGFAYFKRGLESPEMQGFAKMSMKTFAIRRPGSAALDLAYTAAGFFDGYWEKGISPWDVAAGALLVQEAGGVVTDYNGQPFSISKDEIIASSFTLQKEIHSCLFSN